MRNKYYTKIYSVFLFSENNAIGSKTSRDWRWGWGCWFYYFFFTLTDLWSLEELQEGRIQFIHYHPGFINVLNMKNSSKAYKEKTSFLVRYHGAMVCSKELLHVRNPIKGAQIFLPAHFCKCWWRATDYPGCWILSFRWLKLLFL